MVYGNIGSVIILQGFWSAGCPGPIILTTTGASVGRDYHSQDQNILLFTRKESLAFIFNINPVV